MKAADSPTVDLSIIIKTLNEEANLGRCLDAITALNLDIVVEVIIADSGSTDKTVQIASAYPVVVVQLANKAEKSCGIGPQLGYQHSCGKYLLLLDADMVLHGAFVMAAIEKMKHDLLCGGVGGLLVEKSGTGYEYDLRRRATKDDRPEVQVKWLDGFGMYRRTAIRAIGYLSNRNLHAYEEKELGMRLTAAGWRLCRLEVPAVDHFGHSFDTLTLLKRRWSAGYAQACGESIRACIGKPYFGAMLLVHKALLVCLAFQAAVVMSVALAYWSYAPLAALLAVTILGLVTQAIRKNGMTGALHSFLYTNLFAIGLVRGIMTKPTDPNIPVASIILK